MTENTAPSGHPLIPDTASWGRRVAALLVDWFTSSLVAGAILGSFEVRAYQWLVLAVFWLETSVGVALTGSSFGQKFLGIEVHRLDNMPLRLLRAMERQLLVLLVIPPLVFRQDGRGLHDILTDSAAYRHSKNPV